MSTTPNIPVTQPGQAKSHEMKTNSISTINSTLVSSSSVKGASIGISPTTNSKYFSQQQRTPISSKPEHKEPKNNSCAKDSSIKKGLKIYL